MKFLAFLLAVSAAVVSASVYVAESNITYEGFVRNGVEVFLGIPYAQDTSGQNRFKPPQPFSFPPNSIVNATLPGPACPQQLGQWNAPLTLLNVTKDGISEDCLNLNIVRPVPGSFTLDPKGMAVMVWIHGGSFWVGSNMEPTHQPDGLVLNSVSEGTPIIHVAINYRLGFFGFAKSDALRQERSENAGLRDQRAAIEWVRDNIHYFGGDENRITIHGQSSGGLAVGMQLLAYGGTKELPYQQGICQSQALEPGITGNFTRDAMQLVIEKTNCKCDDSYDSAEVVACLRSKNMQTLYDASAATYVGDIAHNIGDVWLPSIDGDFLPDAPSKLLAEGRFGNATYMMGWAQDDVNFFTNVSIATVNETLSFFKTYLPNVDDQRKPGWGSEKESNTEQYLSLYPAEEFAPQSGTNLTSEFYRTARAFRDILMVCEPILLAEAINRWKGSKVYLYNFNQTLLDPIIESVYGVKGMGVVHTSEFAYTFGNLSAYNVSGYPFNPTEADYSLVQRASRSWATFAHTGNPSKGYTLLHQPGSLQNWWPAFWRLGEDPVNLDNKPRKPGHTWVYTIGGANEGGYPLDGPKSNLATSSQGLVEKCAFFNDPEFIRRAGF